MDNIIKKIVEIDKRALRIKKETEERIKDIELSLKDTMDKIEKEELDRAKSRGEEEYMALVNEGKEVSKDILKNKNREYKRLDEIFLRKRRNLRDKVLEHIVNID